MQIFERNYIELVASAINYGDTRMDRTGVGTRALFATQLVHNWVDGFPLITHRQLGTKAAFAEMACWLKGITDVDELAKRGCKWWEANLQSYNERNKDRYLLPDGSVRPGCAGLVAYWEKNRQLGHIYGSQWRNFAVASEDNNSYDLSDQLTNVLEEAKRNPTSRRLLVTAWNPTELRSMALPPCYYSFQLFIHGDRLDLLVNMRSVDVILGLPNDILGNAFLQLAICHELGKKPGRLIFSMADTHIYENHVELAIKMVADARSSGGFQQAAKWEYNNPPAKAEDFEVENVKVYFDQPHVATKYSFPMAV